MKDVVLATIAVITVLGLFFGIYFTVTAEEPQRNVASTTVQPVQEEVNEAPTAEKILELVNEERAKKGVAPLILMEEPTLSAQYKASDMDKRDYFGHKDPETGISNGLAYLDKLQDSCAFIGENLVELGDEKSSEEVVRAWVDSKAHYEAMIDPSHVYTGVAVSGDYSVQHFCTPY